MVQYVVATAKKQEAKNKQKLDQKKNTGLFSSRLPRSLVSQSLPFCGSSIALDCKRWKITNKRC